MYQNPLDKGMRFHEIKYIVFEQERVGEASRGGPKEEMVQGGESRRESQKKSISTVVNESQLFSSRWGSWFTDCAQYAGCR